MNCLIKLWLLIAVYKIASNSYCYCKIKWLKCRHEDWIRGKCDSFPTYKAETITLFERAGVKNFTIPTTQTVGYGYLSSFDADIFTNFPSANYDIYNGVLRMFNEAEGVFRHRIFETFNPLYWIDIVLFAPKKLLLYLSIKEDNILFKICNVLFTLIWWIICTVFVFFQPEIKQLIVELLRYLLQKLG